MKKIIIGCIAAGSILVIALVIYFVVLSNKTDSYREVKIYKVDGTTNVERSGGVSLDAYENMQLVNEDLVNVMEASYTQLKMDEDKYALLEPMTSIKLEAEGDAKDSRTLITLEKGSIVNHIENKLSDKSSYEVNTPNSTMAVRATSFKVETYYDENGISHTILVVVDGVVESFLVFPDGSKSEGTKFTKGQKVLIRGDNTTSEYEYIGEADLKELSLEALEFLKLHYREDFYCTEQDINDAIDALRGVNGDSAGVKPSDDSNSDDNTESGTVQENGEENSNTDNNSSNDNNSPKDTENVNDDTNNDPDRNKKDKKTSDKKDEKDEDDEEEENDKDNKEKSEYTVTFKYNDEVFATQKVKEGNKVSEPKLSPDKTGSWDYNFNSKVKKNITIVWKEK